MSSTDGSPTKTCWNRRSSAASFSMRSRYSSSVVAPIMRSSPRASIGLSMLPASIALSPPAPAPTTVCSSSMNVMIWPSEALISLRTAFSRSSNSPRYFAPATMPPRSSAMSRRPLRDSGTSPATMRWARPSTTAVLPTPGSPISTGLFLVRRLRTCTTRRISLSRPMTGSSLPSRATAVRSTPYFSSAWYVSSASWLVTRVLPRTEANAACRASGVAPARRQQLAGRRVDGGDADDEVLAGHELVARVGRPGLAPRCETSCAARDRPRVGHRRPARGRQRAQLVRRRWRRPTASTPTAASSGAGRATGLGQQSVKQVHRLDGRVARRGGGLHSRSQGLLAAVVKVERSSDMGAEVS